MPISYLDLQERLLDGSRTNREVHASFCEWLQRRFLRSTHIAAIPELLKLLNLQGCLVTIDAMGCQQKIATKTLQKGTDYLLSVKDNQPDLAEAFEAAFPMAKVASFEGDAYVTDEENRGRQETRYHIISEVTEEFKELSDEWLGLKSVGVVMSFRQEGDGVPEAPMIRYYISSADLSTKKLAKTARWHWNIEAKPHWFLDVALREGACKIHRGQAAENLARIRHIALNYLERETRFKGSIRRKQKKAALDEIYLTDILAM